MKERIERSGRSRRINFTFGILLLALCVFPLACGGDGDDGTPGPPANSACSQIAVKDMGTYLIAIYEASSSDATPLEEGDDDSMACSQPNVMPWTDVTAKIAEAACDRTGGRLCYIQEWVAACSGAQNNKFPYGNAYDSQACNSWDYYQVTHSFPTGSLPGCVSADGIYDMSGNVMEWVKNPSDGSYWARGGSFLYGESHSFPADTSGDIHDEYNRFMAGVDGLDCQTEEEEGYLTEVFAEAAWGGWSEVGFRCCWDKFE